MKRDVRSTSSTFVVRRYNPGFIETTAYDKSTAWIYTGHVQSKFTNNQPYSVLYGVLRNMRSAGMNFCVSVLFSLYQRSMFYTILLI